MTSSVDFGMLMAYDYAGTWATQTQALTPFNPQQTAAYDIYQTMKYYTSLGVQNSKVRNFTEISPKILGNYKKFGKNEVNREISKVRINTRKNPRIFQEISDRCSWP
jgi:GH18 family chitinase